MRERTRSRALVIGGGIAGLSAAIALQQAGIDVSVFESASTMREVGVGLMLWTNAVRALQKLGLTEALRAIGLASTQASIRSWQGEIVESHKVVPIHLGRSLVKSYPLWHLTAPCWVSVTFGKVCLLSGMGGERHRNVPRGFKCRSAGVQPRFRHMGYTEEEALCTLTAPT